MKSLSLGSIAKKLVTQRKQLMPFLFNGQEKIHPEIRERLLQKINLSLIFPLKFFSDIKIKDVWIVGSAASYYYDDYSDIDVKVIISNDNSPYLSDTPVAIQKFGTAVNRAYNTEILIDDKYIDVKIGSYQVLCDGSIWGKYSLLYDKWLDKPDINHKIATTPKQLINLYFKRVNQMQSFLEGIETDDDCEYPKDKIEQMFRFYNKILEDENIGNIDNYLTQKLMSKTGYLKQFIQQINNNLQGSITSLKYKEKWEEYKKSLLK